MTGRIIESAACVAEGCAWLSAAEPRFRPAIEAAGLPPVRRVPEGFVSLRNIVMGQMVSTASARAIVARLDAAGIADGDAVRTAGPQGLAACGLSRQKARTLLAVADGGVDFAALGDLPDTEVTARLTAIPGIGPWTADLYLMTALGRADSFAPGDLALREAARLLFDLADRPSVPALADLAGAWSPWRGVAARVLWAYYRVRTQREGLA